MKGTEGKRKNRTKRKVTKNTENENMFGIDLRRERKAKKEIKEGIGQKHYKQKKE